MKKLNIAIDVDDTITDTFSYMQPYIAEYYNMDINFLKENDISYNTLLENMKEKELDFSRKYYENVILDVPIKDGAVKYITKLKNLGHNIYIITARDNNVYNDAYKVTSSYLNKHNIPFDKLICNGDKVTACKENSIDILVDDSIHNCENVSKSGTNVLMFASKGNKNITKFDKIHNWEEAFEYLINYANK